MTIDRPLLTVFPALQGRVRFEALGDLPTPVQSLERLTDALERPNASAWIKRDDLTSSIYGGNKVRTLEVLFGDALAQGATRVFATGAFGSNHAVATLLHAPRVGLEGGALLFPQPPSEAAAENLRVTLEQRPALIPLRHWSTLPLGMWRARRSSEPGERRYIMVPGGATPLGALGYVSAALELAQQVAAGALPAPSHVVVGVGSTCTSAGLLVGLHHAARLGIGFTQGPPRLVSVRVTPWPVTARARIAWLAHQTSKRLADLAEDPSLIVPWRTLHDRLEVDGRFLGAGYGEVTRAGLEAIRLFEEHAGARLDTTYSGKSAAAVVHRIRAGARGPLLYWATKSTAPLPEVSAAALRDAPAPMRRWLERFEGG